MNNNNLRKALEANRFYYTRMYEAMRPPHERIRLEQKQVLAGFYREVAEMEARLQTMEQELYGHSYHPARYSWRKADAFDFVCTIDHGRTLLLGECNLSFAISLAETKRIIPGYLTATTFETERSLSSAGQQNAKLLRSLGVSVIYGVDATDLAANFGAMRFDNIVFQFPHVGSRDPVEGHNPNFILVRDFLISAASQLTRNGQVLISAVDSPHYQGAFQFDDAAKIAGFLSPSAYPFDPSAFPGYEHTMTHQDGNALDNHDEFSTWVFKPA
ncbi:MAG: DUF2431 domain-containing protein [Pseudomonadota bacterium]|nr:DUF2431 domain-containing protein [Pseudomonadota bacterium]